MKKIQVNFRVYLTVIFSLCFVLITSAQESIEYKQIESKTKIPFQDSDMPVLVFETDLSLEFSSSTEDIPKSNIKKKQKKYFLQLTPGAQVITLVDSADKSQSRDIKFGQMDNTDFPALKRNDEIFFNVYKIKTLSYFDDTAEKKMKGASDFPAQGKEEDALIILIPSPPDLIFNVTTKDPLSKIITKEGGKKNVYISYKYPSITLQKDRYENKEIVFENLSSKDVKYIQVADLSIHTEKNKEMEELMYKLKAEEDKIRKLEVEKGKLQEENEKNKKIADSKIKDNNSQKYEYSIENSSNMFAKGKEDAKKNYKGLHSGFGWVSATTLILTPIIGVLPAAICSSVKPRDRNLNYQNPDLMNNPSYNKGFISEARKIKRKKIWRSFGISSAIWISLIVLAGK